MSNGACDGAAHYLVLSRKCQGPQGVHCSCDYATVVTKGSQRSNNMGENTLDFDLGSITASIWVQTRGGQRVQGVDMPNVETAIHQQTTIHGIFKQFRKNIGGSCWSACHLLENLVPWMDLQKRPSQGR